MIDKNQASQMGINIIQSEQENNALFNTLKTKFPQTIKDGQVMFLLYGVYWFGRLVFRMFAYGEYPYLF